MFNKSATTVSWSRTIELPVQAEKSWTVTLKNGAIIPVRAYSYNIYREWDSQTQSLTFYGKATHAYVSDSGTILQPGPAVACFTDFSHIIENPS